MSEGENRWRPHGDKQEELVFSDADETFAITGTQFGKSFAGAVWLKRQIHTFTDPKDNFLLMAPTYKIMNQSMLPYFLSAMDGFGKWRGADGEFKIHGGGTVFCRTETDPDSIVGIPNVRAYWLDEAGKCRLYFRENIRARAASKGARGLNTTSPYSLNWVYKDVLKPLQAGLLPDTKLIQAASWENPYHKLYDVKERDKERARMDPRRFNMIYGGTFGRMDGLVYDCWDDAENLIQAFQLPPSTRFVGGIDWGYYPDPFTLKVRAITPDGKHYGVSEFVKTKLTPTDIAQVVAQKASVFGMKKIWADPSNPGMIEELNRQLSMLKIQCSVQGADNDIDRGVGLHYELIKTRKYKEFIGACPYSSDEREVYHYPEEKDLKPDQNSKDLKPVDQNNHCMDNDRYITIMEYRSDVRHAPKVPGDQKRQETMEERLRRLRKRPNADSGAECW